mmetsp:Transcript_11027/g.12601  ORF Transcript_11027/g.12601 Transcript_11027/m.12601 type:complete len:123 (-) Transcript_11027:128-496(-)
MAMLSQGEVKDDYRGQMEVGMGSQWPIATFLSREENNRMKEWYDECNKAFLTEFYSAQRKQVGVGVCLGLTVVGFFLLPCLASCIPKMPNYNDYYKNPPVPADVRFTTYGRVVSMVITFYSE